MSICPNPDSRNKSLAQLKMPSFHFTRRPEIDRCTVTCYDVTDGHSKQKAVGSATYKIQTCELALLSVNPDRRNEGIGSRLLEAAEADMRRNGCESCRLLAYPEDQHSFERLHRFYRRNGYDYTYNIGWLPWLSHIFDRRPRNYMWKKL